MDPNQLNELTKFLLTTLQESKAFVLAQAPGVAQEYVTYIRASTVAFGVVYGLLWVVFAYMWTFRWYDKHDDCILYPGMVGIGVALLIFVLTVIGIDHLPVGLQAWFAPRVLLLEWVRGML